MVNVSKIATTASSYKDLFLNRMEKIVIKKDLQKYVTDQGWYSEEDMATELKWSKTCPQIRLPRLYVAKSRFQESNHRTSMYLLHIPPPKDKNSRRNQTLQSHGPNAREDFC